MYTTWATESDESTLVDALGMERKDIPHSVMTHVISSIKVSDMSSAVKALAAEKVKASCPENRHCYSIYRDLLFLSFVALGRDNIDQGMFVILMFIEHLANQFSLLAAAFDREYRRAHETLSPQHHGILTAIDKPPSFGAIFCRRSFKRLELKRSVIRPNITVRSDESPSSSAIE